MPAITKTPFGVPEKSFILHKDVVVYLVEGAGCVHLSDKANNLIPFEFRAHNGWYTGDASFFVLMSFLPRSVRSKLERYCSYDYEMEPGGDSFTGLSKFYPEASLVFIENRGEKFTDTQKIDYLMSLHDSAKDAATSIDHYNFLADFYQPNSVPFSWNDYDEFSMVELLEPYTPLRSEESFRYFFKRNFVFSGGKTAFTNDPLDRSGTSSYRIPETQISKSKLFQPEHEKLNDRSLIYTDEMLGIYFDANELSHSVASCSSSGCQMSL